MYLRVSFDLPSTISITFNFSSLIDLSFVVMEIKSRGMSVFKRLVMHLCNQLHAVCGSE